MVKKKRLVKLYFNVFKSQSIYINLLFNYFSLTCKRRILAKRVEKMLKCRWFEGPNKSKNFFELIAPLVIQPITSPQLSNQSHGCHMTLSNLFLYDGCIKEPQNMSTFFFFTKKPIRSFLSIYEAKSQYIR